MFSIRGNGKKTLGLCVFITFNAGASDGTVRFTGNITDQTCSIDSGSLNQNVVLGKVAKNSLNGTVGLKSASTRFTLVVKSCPETVTKATFKFDGMGDDKNPSLLALDKGTGAATGVAIEIADRTGVPISLHTNSPEYPLTSGTNSLDFIARYVSTLTAVSVGTANATTQFTIVYN